MSELSALRKALDGLAFAAYQYGEAKQSALGDCANVADWIAQAMAHAEAYAAAERAAERERWRAAILSEVGHAETNDNRLVPSFGKAKGSLAVRAEYLLALIERAQPEPPQHPAPSGRLKER